MLSNSAFAGLLAAVYLTWLLLHLNPSVPLTMAAVSSLLTVTLVSYGVHIFVVSYVLYVVRIIALTEPSTPGWISLRLLTWSAAALSGAAAVISWLHASGLRTTLDPLVLPGLTRAAGLFAGATVLFLLLALAQLATRRRGRATVAVLFTLATISSIVGPLAVRRRPADAAAQASGGGVAGPNRFAREPAGPRVVLLCLDGASLDVISPAVAAGRLPNFGRLLDRGVSMHLETTRPTQPESAWTSVMTGTWPSRHGIRAAATYRAFNSDVTLDVLPDYLFSHALVRFGLLIEEPHSSRDVRALPIWRLLNRSGMSAAVIGLPLTHPVDATAALMVSDQFHRRSEREIQVAGTEDIHPHDLAKTATVALIEDPVPAATLRARLDLVPQTAGSASLIAADRVHHRLVSLLSGTAGVQLLAIRYPGLDAVGHYSLRYARPDAFGAATEEERRGVGRLLDDYYAYVDSLVGDALARLRDDDVLMVVSPFGMEPLPVAKRLLERVVGDERFTGTHERAPDGFLMAFGAPVASGRLPRGAVVDIVPTLLYFLGLPVARDMDGSARTDVFTRPFNAQRTITSIPTYEAP